MWACSLVWGLQAVFARTQPTTATVMIHQGVHGLGCRLHTCVPEPCTQHARIDIGMDFCYARGGRHGSAHSQLQGPPCTCLRHTLSAGAAVRFACISVAFASRARVRTPQHKAVARCGRPKRAPTLQIHKGWGPGLGQNSSCCCCGARSDHGMHVSKGRRQIPEPNLPKRTPPIGCHLAQ